MDVNAFKAELKKWLRDVIEKGVSAEEIQKAKTNLIAQVAFLKDGNMQTMQNFVGIAMGETLEDFENYADGIKAVTEGEVHQAAKDVLGQMPCVTMDLYPEG
jgi:predicted Zn-dependent peptidase